MFVSGTIGFFSYPAPSRISSKNQKSKLKKKGLVQIEWM